ncbi:MAG: T9SS type A sorting domain-containing protein, partial [Bacteroidota bacterium]
VMLHWNTWSNTGGGIIQADNSDFYNNNRSISFIPYSGDNVSYINNCRFEIDDAYPSNNYIGMITMWDVNGVEITNCEFINDNSSISNRENAIYTIDAGFNITGTSSFDGFEGGVYATNSNTLNTFTVDGATFTNNALGIYAGSVDNVEVLRNTYTVGQYNTPDYSHGLYLDRSTGFHVEGNTFNGNETTTSGPSPIGVECDNTGDDYNRIYRNIFDDLMYGNHAFGDNRDKTIERSTGLEYLCNENTNNLYDFYVDKDISILSPNSGVKFRHGLLSQSAGNTFSLNSSPAGSDFENLSNHTIDYYYDNGTNRNPINTYNFNKLLANNANTCGDQISGAMAANLRSEDLEQEMLRYRNTYLNLHDQRLQKLDNGKTEILLANIATTSKAQAGNLIDQLLQLSPWVSVAAFLAILDKEELIGTEDLKTLLLRNPDVLADAVLLEKLKEVFDEKDLAILLEQFAQRNNERTQLEEELSQNFNTMHQLINQLLLEELAGEARRGSKIREWLSYKESVNAQYAIVESWLAEQEAASALQALDQLVRSSELTEKQSLEVEQYQALTQLKVKAMQSKRTIADFDDNEVQQLRVIAETNLGRASTQAQGILDFFYDGKYTLKPQDLNYGSIQKQLSNTGIGAKEAQESISLVKASPNPARDQIRFDLPQLDRSATTNPVLTIYDQNGKVIESLNIPNGARMINWDTSQLQPGIYFFRVVGQGGMIGNGRFFITR